MHVGCAGQLSEHNTRLWRAKKKQKQNKSFPDRARGRKESDGYLKVPSGTLWKELVSTLALLRGGIGFIFETEKGKGEGDTR